MIELCQAGLGSAEYLSGDVATHKIAAGKDMWDTTPRGYSPACIEYGALTINPGTARRSARGCPSQIPRLQVLLSHFFKYYDLFYFISYLLN